MADSKRVTVTIRPGGKVEFIYDDRLFQALKGLGKATTVRASHVEPDGDTWTVDLRPSGGPVVPGFVTRDEGLEFEVDWLKKNWLNRN